jgi:GxxExxY protein
MKSCPTKDMEYEEITHKIIGAAYQVHNKLGFGFLESVYKKAMIIELNKDGLKVESEKPLQVCYDKQIVGDFYVDLFVEDAVVVELKSVQNLAKEHEVQLVNYLNALERR